MVDLRPYRMTEIAKEHARRWVKPGDVVLDATVGSGFDTLLLADLVGENGKVYAFDIQREAIEKARVLLQNRNQVLYILDSHSNTAIHIQEPLDFAMFNLGFMPGGDKECTTMSTTTIKAIQVVLSQLKVDGAMTLCVYPGHEEGHKESQLIEKMFSDISPKETFVLKTSMVNDARSPYCLLVVKKKIRSLESRD